MSAYAIAHLRAVDVNEQILEYMERIDATLEPFSGRFLVHGVQPEVIEEPWPGVVIVIEFPDADSARAWYASEPYQDILALRTENSDGSAVILEGVEPGYRAAETAAKLRFAA